MRIAIIGGGITGLSAAYRLIELSATNSLELKVNLFEASPKLGGVISTRQKDGFVFEEGPDSFITSKPWGINLCKRIGLYKEIIYTNNERRKTYVVHKGKLTPIPDGFFMLAPTSFIPFLLSPLFSWKGKLRILSDLFIPAPKEHKDESLTTFVKRRLGKEALDKIAQPLISGIYTADPDKLSLRASMPNLIEMEKEYGSVIKGMLRQKDFSEKSQKKGSGARYSQFVSLKGGMKTLVDTIVSTLPPESIKLNHTVENLSLSDDSWKFITNGEKSFEADFIIIATPTYVTGHLIRDIDTELADLLLKIKYASSAVVNLCYESKNISHPLDGLGFVVPKVEGRKIIACSFSSIKFEGRAPEEFRLFRVFIGGEINPEVYELDDSNLVKLAHEELKDLLCISSNPVFSNLKRHPNSMPQYNVGHLELIEKINTRIKNYPTLKLAGNGFGGVGIPDCINSGETAAENIIETIKYKYK